MDQTLGLRHLLEAGVHFGHRSRRWNPRMKPYIFGKRQGIYVIDLEKTLERLRIACQVAREIAETGKDLLFVGTKQQAKPIIKEEAERCGSWYVTERWVGGLLTNFEQVSKQIARLSDLERMRVDGRLGAMSKKDQARFEREYAKLAKLFGGVKDMDRLPGAIFVIDAVKEKTPIAEARRMRIPVIALIDTNGNPELVDYPIPGNDDAMRSIKLFAGQIALAVMEGKKGFESEKPQSRR
ncbi:MAG: 30S ribosomal protein S2 [candidate division WOR-3 bacterium]